MKEVNLKLTNEQCDVLRDLLATMMLNQVITDKQQLINNSINSIALMKIIQDAQAINVEKPVKKS